jgi:hypothetical protein
MHKQECILSENAWRPARVVFAHSCAPDPKLRLSARGVIRALSSRYRDESPEVPTETAFAAGNPFPRSEFPSGILPTPAERESAQRRAKRGDRPLARDRELQAWFVSNHLGDCLEIPVLRRKKGSEIEAMSESGLARLLSGDVATAQCILRTWEQDPPYADDGDTLAEK